MTEEERREKRRARERELYTLYRSRGICYRCGREDAVAAGLCGECYYKVQERRRQYDMAHREQRRARGRARHQRRIAAGVCVLCGKRPAETGKRYCAQCLKAIRARHNARNAAKRAARPEGKCRRCDRAQAPGYKYCEAHLAQVRASMAKARESINRQKHPWRDEARLRARRPKGD